MSLLMNWSLPATQENFSAGQFFTWDVKHPLTNQYSPFKIIKTFQRKIVNILFVIVLFQKQYHTTVTSTIHFTVHRYMYTAVMLQNMIL